MVFSLYIGLWGAAREHQQGHMHYIFIESLDLELTPGDKL
jgi:hypothetical protein